MPTFRKRGVKFFGFSLIEFLIVVAIIAVLLTISAPYYLAARTRAKVGRTASDMRTVAAVLESYLLDYGVYPRSDDRWARSEEALIRITTPVAYLASLPRDAFNKTDFNWDGMSPDPSNYGYGRRNFAYMSHNADADPPHANREAFESDFNNWTGRDWALPQGWQLRSLGPDLGPSALPYDPTNGAKSAGDIARFNTGVENE